VAMRFSRLRAPTREFCSRNVKAGFSELIDETLEHGPQVVTRRGIDTAVVVSVEEWRGLNDQNRQTWKDVLLGDEPRFKIPLPKRGTGRWRKPLVLD
jgi:antitoxin Phd